MFINILMRLVKGAGELPSAGVQTYKVLMSRLHCLVTAPQNLIGFLRGEITPVHLSLCHKFKFTPVKKAFITQLEVRYYQQCHKT